MSNDIVKKDPANLVDDGFAGWEDGVEGDDCPQSSGIIKGTKIKFSNNAIWLRRDDTELPDIELIPVFILRVVQTWGKDNRPIEEKTIIRAAPEIPGHRKDEREGAAQGLGRRLQRKPSRADPGQSRGVLHPSSNDGAIHLHRPNHDDRQRARHQRAP